MKVKDLIAKLQTLNEDANVTIIVDDHSRVSVEDVWVSDEGLHFSFEDETVERRDPSEVVKHFEERFDAEYFSLILHYRYNYDRVVFSWKQGDVSITRSLGYWQPSPPRLRVRHSPQRKPRSLNARKKISLTSQEWCDLRRRLITGGVVLCILIVIVNPKPQDCVIALLLLPPVALFWTLYWSRL